MKKTIESYRSMAYCRRLMIHQKVGICTAVSLRVSKTDMIVMKLTFRHNLASHAMIPIHEVIVLQILLNDSKLCLWIEPLPQPRNCCSILVLEVPRNEKGGFNSLEDVIVSAINHHDEVLHRQMQGFDGDIMIRGCLVCFAIQQII
jgi:hypothetical protein